MKHDFAQVINDARVCSLCGVNWLIGPEPAGECPGYYPESFSTMAPSAPEAPTAEAARSASPQQEENRPRVHGNGFIQLDLSSSRRLHIWGHPSIPQQATPSQHHDHAFGFVSDVLCGSMTNVWYRAELAQDGPYDVLVPHPRKAEDTGLVWEGARVRLVETRRVTVHAGQRYSMEPGEIHESIPHGPTATIIAKTYRRAGTPQVFVPHGQQPDNVFDRYAEPPENLWNIIIDVLSQASSVQPDAGIDDVVSAGSPSDLASWVDLESETLIASLEMELATLRSTHATLQSALRKYGVHTKECESTFSTNELRMPCSCGLDLALSGAQVTEVGGGSHPLTPIIKGNL